MTRSPIELFWTAKKEKKCNQGGLAGPPSTQGHVKSGQELEVTVWDGTEYKEKRKPLIRMDVKKFKQMIVDYISREILQPHATCQ